MAEENKNIPELRFQGFSGPWEKRKLGTNFSERVERSGSGEMLSVTINDGIVLTDSLDRKDNSSQDKSHYKVVLKKRHCLQFHENVARS